MFIPGLAQEALLIRTATIRFRKIEFREVLRDLSVDGIHLIRHAFAPRMRAVMTEDGRLSLNQGIQGTKTP